MKLADNTKEVINEYNLHALATPDGSVHIKATKGMYGIPQAGLLANKLQDK